MQYLKEIIYRYLLYIYKYIYIYNTWVTNMDLFAIKIYVLFDNKRNAFFKISRFLKRITLLFNFSFYNKELDIVCVKQ